MAKIACRVCIAVAILAIILQITATFTPYFDRAQLFGANAGLKGGVMGFKRYEYEFYLWKLVLKIDKFSLSNQAEAEMMDVFYDSCFLPGSTEPINCFDTRCKAERANHNGCDLVFLDGWSKCSNGKMCKTIPITECFNTMHNEFTSSGIGRLVLPDMPFMGPSGYFIFFGSIFTMILSFFSCLALIAGSIYLYYYSEHKPVKKARTGATVFFSAAPILAFVGTLISLIVMLMASTQTAPNPAWRLAAPKSTHTPVWGFWLALCNMVIMSVTLCFSKYWKQRKSENARALTKQREEDDQIMRAMGLDPNAQLHSSSAASSMSDSHSDSDSDSSDSEADEKRSLNTVRSHQRQQPQPGMMGAPMYAQYPQQVYPYGQQPRPVYYQNHQIYA